MRPQKFIPKDILKLFYEEKVLTKDQLQKMAGCSTMTAWRILNEHGYITSYNFNAKYYTLHDIPIFDEYGLWSYRKIHFSKYGSLTETIIVLILNSTSGLAGDELRKLLNINVAPILIKLFHQDKIYREKVMGRFIYLHSDKQCSQDQLSRRRDETQTMIVNLPEPEKIIAVLVELIQRIELGPQEVARRLSRKEIKITITEIKSIFNYYELHKKKLLKS